MIQPSRAQFHSWAADYSVVPVWQELLADQTTPVAAFQRITQAGEPGSSQAGAPAEHGFLLESVERAESWGRRSFLGRRPLAVIRSHGLEVELNRLPLAGTGDAAGAELPPELPLAWESVPRNQGLLAALDAWLPQLRTPEIPELGSFASGLVGYLGYDIVREVEQLPNRPPEHHQLPDSYLSLAGEVAVFDHWRQTVTLVRNVLVPPQASEAELDQLYDQATASLQEFAADGAQGQPEPLFAPALPDLELPETSVSLTPEQYHAAVEAAKEFILDGDIFQVVLSMRFDFELDAEPLDVYRVLRQINPSPYMYYFAFPELAPQTCIIGSSPEPLVKLTDGRVVSRPIAGTRRRGRSDTDDERMAAELLEHPKEKAEHIMLVDLARNDICRVIDYGSLHIDELMTLERYSHVMHMTSQVSGVLQAGKTPVDVLRATLPAGTVSGAPKVRAMEIIDDLEPQCRGPYAGTVGYVGLSGEIDAAITIRTMIVQGNQASVQAGAGIVADSVPADEELECRNKARALLQAVPVARQMAQMRQQQQSRQQQQPRQQQPRQP